MTLAAKLRNLEAAEETSEQRTTMQAIVHDRYGPPDEVLDLREVDKPVPADDEVLVRVHAASTNGGDSAVVRGAR